MALRPELEGIAMMIEGSSDLSIIGLPNNLLPVGGIHRSFFLSLV
jgi:hypothetical protein